MTPNNSPRSSTTRTLPLDQRHTHRHRVGEGLDREVPGRPRTPRRLRRRRQLHRPHPRLHQLYEIDAANLSTSIGYTFYAVDAQGIDGPTRPPSTSSSTRSRIVARCGRSSTHESNAQSRAAIAKLGATFEGLLRAPAVRRERSDGDVTGWRTTAQYAMTTTIGRCPRDLAGAGCPARPDAFR